MIPPLTFACVRLALGSLCLFAVLSVRGEIALPRRRDAPLVFSAGLLQLAAFLAFANLGLERIEAGRSAILAYTTPIWVAPLAMVFLGERLGRLGWAGLAAGLTGVGVLFNPLGFDWHDPDALAGNGFLLLGALAWALTIMHIRRHGFELSPLQLAPWQMLVAIVPLAALAALFESGAEVRLSGPLLAILAYNGPFATAFAFWAWLTVNRALPAITTSMASLGVPVAGVAAGALALGEPLTVTNGLGLVLVTAGLALITAAPHRAVRPTGT